MATEADVPNTAEEGEAPQAGGEEQPEGGEPQLAAEDGGPEADALGGGEEYAAAAEGEGYAAPAEGAEEGYAPPMEGGEGEYAAQPEDAALENGEWNAAAEGVDYAAAGAQDGGEYVAEGGEYAAQEGGEYMNEGGEYVAQEGGEYMAEGGEYAAHAEGGEWDANNALSTEEQLQMEEALGEAKYSAGEAVGGGGQVDDRLTLETKAREELEDMILRIEKHFKAEQAARKKAEELLQQAIAAEMDAKNTLEDVMRQRQQEQKQLDEERAAVKRERHSLETMRQEFENELQAARSEVGKAQDALSGSEDRIRAAELLERNRMEADYQAKLANVSNDLIRTQQETAMHSRMMQEEMNKWKQQAAVVGNAVMEAKNEVLQRKRELDSTRENMDRLVDKLMMGREMGIQLTGAIEGNQRAMAYMGSPMVGMHHAGGPPGKMMPSMMMPPMGAGAMGPWMSPPPPTNHGRNSKHPTGHPVTTAASKSAGMTTSPKLPPISQGGKSMGSMGNMEQFSPPRAGKGASMSNLGHHQGVDPNQYAHVQSKLYQQANGSPAQKKAANTKAKKPDRAAEAERESKRMAAMARMFN